MLFGYRSFAAIRSAHPAVHTFPAWRRVVDHAWMFVEFT